MGDWVHHRTYGVGRVLERHGRVRIVRFSDRVRQVDGKYRPLDEDSIEVRAHLDPEGFPTWIDDAPVDATSALLRDRRDGVDEQQAVRRLTELGVPKDQAGRWWKQKAEPSLRERDDVMVVGDDPARFALREGPDPKKSVEEATAILERLAKKRLAADQRTKLSTDFSSLDRTATLPVSVRGAAVALGIVLPDPPPLRDVQPAELPADVVRRLVERGDANFTARAVVDARGTEVAREAAERCIELAGVAERAGLAATVCAEATREISEASTEDVGGTAERLANRVKRLRLLVPDGATPVLVAEVLLLIDATLAKRSDDKQLGRLRRAAEDSVVVPAGTFDALAGALRLDQVQALSDEVLATTWSEDRLMPDSTRLAWLRALSQGRSSVLDGARAWRDIGLGDLQQLAGAEETRRWLFESAAGRRRFGTVVVSTLRRLDRTTLGDLIAGSGDVLSRLPAEAVRDALERLADDDPSLAVIRDGFAAPRVAEAERRHLDELDKFGELHTESLRAAEARIADAESRADSLSAEAQLARRLMETASSTAAGAAELRQTRLDGLQVAAAVLAEIERAAGRSPDVDELATRLRTVAEAKGLRREAATEAVVRFDHRRHRPLLDEALTDGDEVVVVEPAWVIDEGDDVTAVRYGLVRVPVAREEGDTDGRDDVGSRLRDDDHAGGTKRRAVEHDDPARNGPSLDADAGGRRP